MSLRNLLVFIVATTIFLPAASAAEAVKQRRFDYKSLQQRAADFVQQQVTAPENGRIEVIASGLDPRMQPKLCANDLQLSIAGNNELDSYSTVEIRCEGQQLWRTYVPVRIYEYRQVITAAGSMMNEHVISAGDLQLREVNVNNLRSQYYTEPDQLIGARIKRRVSAGDVISARDTCLVCEGEAVTITATSGNLTITATGVALADGLQGEAVTVRNQRSNKALQAHVSGLNEVKVGN
ncbi:flagella basal body P-ring formation protein FlgA [Idiomarina tyrosinivorans]|uniref:Flagella basal body P-ring formation protein FlgA n=1 Tax=Idiomarina tyrosinivorans TaxID=1445662 RepID=A0A432ZPJ4_9GAMM|nr:flagellar basal body P-ring formation chaperone FlgA [Idiomarina tyrosinivorans]RUO79845.1 flagella basal body P-ring formation protein FlgA [Idiomarina tyrosinivorans]